MRTARWSHAAPVHGPMIAAPLVFFSILAAIALALSVWRLFGGLAFTGMNDDFAIGVWKTFNVMTLTALGSSAIAAGMTTWIFNQRQLHVVMRAALTSSILFYGTGMFALGFDVGRPWNFYHVVIPWHWNPHSALLEVSVCMTAYVAIFLLYENLPTVLPPRWFARIRPLYPYMVAGAFLLPAMHQSSLGSLMVIAGTKVHPLWQTQMLPAFYLIQAVVCGFASLILILMIACLAWNRPLDVPVLGTLAKFMAWSSIVFVALRYADVVLRGRAGLAFDASWYALLFHGENLFVLVPALALLNERRRAIPRVLLVAAAATAIGGLVYRFSPTTLAFRYGRASIYFPSIGELLMCLGYIGLAIALFILAVRRFAILPDRAPE
ncbi:MAG TPA: Ni/Fe-hydrogenase cytochrome b subunit [Thermoanaerobaculia bacterium]|nr:Ni/Fe-hydrogenase cytochrome b subunit [Thermoanaerobaculia bacterium]